MDCALGDRHHTWAGIDIGLQLLHDFFIELSIAKNRHTETVEN
jgi:hypothetical protein